MGMAMVEGISLTSGRRHTSSDGTGKCVAMDWSYAGLCSTSTQLFQLTNATWMHVGDKVSIRGQLHALAIVAYTVSSVELRLHWDLTYDDTNCMHGPSLMSFAQDIFNDRHNFVISEQIEHLYVRHILEGERKGGTQCTNYGIIQNLWNCTQKRKKTVSSSSDLDRDIIVKEKSFPCPTGRLLTF